MKIFIIYHTPSKGIYAWTFDKKIAHKFLDQRFRQKFYLKKVNDEEYDVREFMYENKDKKLIDIPLITDGKDILIVGTGEEEGKFNSICEDIEQRLDDVRAILTTVHWNKKYRNLISDATQILKEEKSISDGMVYDEIKLDTFSIFYDTFLETFVSDEEYERRKSYSLM